MAFGGKDSGGMIDSKQVENIFGDPGGYVTGTNQEGFGGVKKLLFGDPDAIKKAYEEAMGMSRAMGQEAKNFLMQQREKSLGYFKPIQHMFENTYGTEGIAGPQIPRSPGMTIQGMYGAR